MTVNTAPGGRRAHPVDPWRGGGLRARPGGREVEGMLIRLLSLALSAAPALPEQVFAAHLVVEVEVPVKQSKPEWAKRAVTRVLLPRGGEAPKTLALPTPKWPRCSIAGPVSFLVFFTQDEKGAWTAQPVDARATSLDASWPALLAALEVAGGWHEERMRAVPDALLWADERRALRSDDAWQRALAVAFLTAHDSAAVVDAAWGAPGTPERKAEEAKATLPPPTCR